MSDIKGVFKGGWHPKGKDGGRESWRGDYKGINQVAGWVGKGKKPGADGQENTHVSRPLATLKDPSSFGPPPKNVNYHGGVALPNEITPHTSGLGAPLKQYEIDSARETASAALEEEPVVRAAPPPLPFRSDRTGLKSDNLPPPPIRRDVGGSEDVSQQRSTGPNLPPRLPARQNTISSPVDSPSLPQLQAAPPQGKPLVSGLNQSAVNRLGNAGIAVPSLGIGRNTGSPHDEHSSNKDQNQANQISELSSRFQRFNSSSGRPADQQTATSPSTQAAAAPTWTQAQSTLKTAQNFHKDPSSVSLSDAQQAAATAQQAHTNAQAFRTRHADRFDAAERKATALNKKYNMTGRLNKFLEDANNEHDQAQQQHLQQQGQQSPQSPQPLPAHQSSPNISTNIVQAQPAYQRASPVLPIQSPHANPAISDTSQVNADNVTKPLGRKPPPPPPPKKPISLQAPPPIPLGTRPSF